jgi:hypothetical protein
VTLPCCQPSTHPSLFPLSSSPFCVSKMMRWPSPLCVPSSTADACGGGGDDELYCSLRCVAKG